MELVQDTEIRHLIGRLKTSEPGRTIWSIESTVLDDAIMQGLIECRTALEDSLSEKHILIGILLI